MDFKNAIFLFELKEVPPELQVISGIAEAFGQFNEASRTLVQQSRALEDAAVTIDDFKARTCGSAYSLAIINLNFMTDIREIEFLLRPNVLGDPRTIFMASLRYMVGDAYGLAKDKVQRENECRERSPSCIDCYSSSNRDEVFPRISVLSSAYLLESEEWAKGKREGRTGVLSTHASRLLTKSSTGFFGRGMTSGIYRAVGSSSNSGRTQKLEVPLKKNEGNP